MNIFRRLASQPFVVATGFAALIHSTWSLGTFFSGPQPAWNTAEYWQWLTPAILIAFSLDVGQVITSAEIRAGQRTRVKYATFAIFAIATYYLQFTYIAAHMPAVALGVGIAPALVAFIGAARDAGVFLLPLLLPLSTLLYTFSQGDERAAKPPIKNDARIDNMLTSVQAGLTPLPGHKWLVLCSDCEWTNYCDSREAAARSLRSHRRKHAAASVSAPMSATISSNGHGERVSIERGE